MRCLTSYDLSVSISDPASAFIQPSSADEVKQESEQKEEEEDAVAGLSHLFFG